jgi:hypothetical protein
LLARAVEVAQPAARPPDWVRAISFRDGFRDLPSTFAIQRREQFADTAVFYIPVRIDEGEPLIPASEPRRSKKIQAIRKPGGHLDDVFIEYLRQLQLDYCKSRGLTFTPPPPP